MRRRAVSGGRHGRRGWRILRARRGAAASEFALAAIPATLMFYGIIEVSWQLATAAALDHAALRASRFGITGSNRPPLTRPNIPLCRTDSIPWFASAVTNGFLRPDRLAVSMSSYAAYSASTARTGATRGAGTAGQIVTYQLTYTQPYLLDGLVSLVVGTDAMTYQASITVRNEPFDDEPC